MIDVLFVTRAYHPLLPGFRWNPYLFPIWYFAPELRQRGFRVRYATPASALREDAHTICVDSKAFVGDSQRSQDDIIAFVSRIRGHTKRLVWLDNRDSAGTAQFWILPYVDVYGKRQLYRDRSLYAHPLYGGRLYTDFYHQHYGVSDVPEPTTDQPLASDLAYKLQLTWNFALADYRWCGPVERVLYGFTRSMKLPYQSTKRARPVRISARFGANYGSPTIAFQRARLLELLAAKPEWAPPTERISQALYRRELSQSLAVLSPFGWGELCLRDFETWIAGAALIKPAVNMVETWPDLFVAGETYLPLPWDLVGMSETLAQYLDDEPLLHSVATHGQETFSELWNSAGVDRICEHLGSILSP